ncbi:hypothetical protein SAMN05443246_3255 [Paenibacillus sp. GP183]|nr:hypothetical protein SAMN05443246_3255 [Paenibacillus sp. GP183]
MQYMNYLIYVIILLPIFYTLLYNKKSFIFFCLSLIFYLLFDKIPNLLLEVPEDTMVKFLILTGIAVPSFVIGAIFYIIGTILLVVGIIKIKKKSIH